MAKKKPSFLKRLTLWLISLILVLGIGGYVVSINPQWAAPLFEKALKLKGVEASFSHLTGKWQGYRYQFSSVVSAEVSGAKVEQATVKTILNMQSLWHRQPFIETLSIAGATAEVNVDELPLNTRAEKSETLDYQLFLPRQWSLNCPRCRIDVHNQMFNGSLSGNGQSDKIANVSLSDNQLGGLSLQYDAEKQLLTAQSDYLNINSVTGYPVQLKKLDANFNLQGGWRSQLRADVGYQGIHSKMRLQGEGENRLRLDTVTQGDTLTLFAERQGDKIHVNTKRMDMKLFNHIKPAVLPFLANQLAPEIRQLLQSMTLEGEVSGNVQLYRDANNQFIPESIDATVTHFAINSDDYVLNQVSGKMTYRDALLSYQLNLDNSTLKAADYLPPSLPALSGEISGVWDINQALALPNYIKLYSSAFDSLSLTRDGDNLIVATDQLSTDLIEKFKPVVLSQLSEELAPQVRATLESLSIDGTVSAKVTLDAESYQLKEAIVGLHQMSLQAEQRQMTGVSGDMRFAGDVLNFQVNLDNSLVALPTIFTEKLPKTTGQVVGQFNINNNVLRLKKVDLKNKDVDTVNVQGTVALNEQIVVDLTGGLSNLTLNRLPLYLTKYFPPLTHSFLSKALVTGKKNKATFTLKGNLDAFLKKGFIFKIDVEANDGVFHYLSNNPDVEIKKAKVNIDGKKLTVTVDSANLFTTIKKKTIKAPLTGTAVIENMNAAEIDLKATIKSQPISRLVAIAERSLAQETIKKVKKIADVKGDFDLALDLWLDVHSKQLEERFEVRLNSQNAAVNLTDYPAFVVKRAKASARVNDKGLQEIAIEGTNNQQPINIHIVPFKQKKYSGIKVQAHVEQADSLTVLHQLKLLSREQANVLENYQIVTGRMDTNVDIRLKDDGSLIDIVAHGDLHNTHFDMFGLTSHQPLAMDVLDVDYQAQSNKLTVSISDQLRVEVGLDNEGMLAGILLDNRNTGSAYQIDEGQINWYAQRFDFPRFKDFYDAWSVSDKKAMPRLNYQTDIIIDNARINASILEPIQIEGSLDHLRIASPLISGQVNYQNNHLQANLSRIEVDTLFNLFKTQEVNPEGREVTRIDLARDLPTLDINAEQLIFKGNNVGSATVHTSMQQGRYSIDQLLVNGRGYYFDASGYEAAESQGLTTHIFADFKAENVGNVVQRFGLNDVLDAKFLDVSLNLSWPGKASTLNLRQSYGKANLNAQNIRLVQMSPGVGSIFGMMDIVGILKRVSTDFENLNSNQLSFDTIQGDWNIGGGRAMTRNAYATGSLIELQLVGGADLHRRVFDDMDLTVIPKASNVFPVIGAVAGGVVGGAAGLLVQQALGDSINQAVGIPYVISGEWDTPVVSFVGAGNLPVEQ